MLFILQVNLLSKFFQMKHLYIIGNGFDLHHGINSKFSDFRNWLEDQCPSLLERIEKIYGYCDYDWWGDFENNLASLNAMEFSSKIAFENEPDLLSEHCDRTWNDAQIEVENQLDNIYTEIRHQFHDWIKQLNKPQNDRKIKLEYESSIFFTFNYTKTLESLYNISSSNILHIHGCVDENEQFILGHGKSYKDIEKINPGPYIPEPPDNLTDKELEQYFEEQAELAEQMHEQLAREAAIAGVASQQKPVYSIIENNKNFFKHIKGVQTIHIYGFSFSEIDLPYIEAIIDVVGTENTNWEISDYAGYNKHKIDKFISNHSINSFLIIELSSLLLSKKYRTLFG